ncbi:hypothetical protein DPMN_090487 [Dreissena polymorpha]|uniref:Uncharacterized protein n=1 Tax=Dreissena polymorpha TaxID=45954 RepID=A0A9D4KXT5_DREPO|nr:hypothetical protein DPMN_090487 [Dreissena polymorpha]
MRRVKTYLLSTMGTDRMSGLALLNIHRKREIDLEEVVELFARERSAAILAWRGAMPFFGAPRCPLSKPFSATLPFPKAAALPFHEHPLFSNFIDIILIAP